MTLNRSATTKRPNTGLTNATDLKMIRSKLRKAVDMYYRIYTTNDGTQFFSLRKANRHEQILEERRQAKAMLETIEDKQD